MIWDQYFGLDCMFDSEILDIIHNQVEVVDILDVLCTDYSASKLYNFFLPYVDKEFSDNERLIIAHHDTDYYPSYDSVGNTIYNLIQIITHLNISTDHIVILTKNLGGRLEKEVVELCDAKNVTPIKVLEFSLDYAFPLSVTDLEIKKEKTFLFSFLNGLIRTHRLTMYGWLLEKNLCQYASMSWHRNYIGLHYDVPFQSSDTIADLPEFRTTTPSSNRINHDLEMNRQTKLLHIKHAKTFDVEVKSKNIIGKTNSLETRWRAPFLQDSLVYLVTETVGPYPHVFLSEKTWKAMVSKTPFMIAGSKNSLAWLRDKGFKTFSHVWDEGYDNESCFYKRAEKIAETLADLKDQDWNLVFEQCLPVIEHNFNHLQTFKQEQENNLKNFLSLRYNNIDMPK